VVLIAPRYDPFILEALSALDDRSVPIAEVCRRVGRAAAETGLTRPSYVHLRRLVLAERARKDAERARQQEIRAIVADVAEDLLVGRRVNAYEVADRVRDARGPRVSGSEPQSPTG
jgi:hypothetical protein